MKLHRKDANPKIAELKQLPIFSGLGAKQLTALAQNLDEVTVPAGEKVMKEGRHNDTFWIILDGEANLTVGGNVNETLGRGDILGLPSMFSGLESTADAVAGTRLRVLVASHQQFNSLVSDTEVEIRFKAALFDRLRDEVYQLTQGLAKSAPRAAAKRPARKKTTAG
jgi:CRP-like cAMP-binding protein